MPTHNDKQRQNVSADDPISVTIDASDLTVAAAEPLRNIISRYGRPAIARAFADFQQPSISELAVQLYQMGFTLVHCPTWPNGDGYPKSVVSDVMAQDLRDQLEDSEEVETFLLVATSRDYIAVTNAVKRHDRRVVVVAEEAKVCRELRFCGDEFAILPPTRPERSESARSARLVESARAERLAAERAGAERLAAERAAAERLAAERGAEVGKPERAPEVARSEPQEAKLPSDAEVVAEVRRIVAAEGICTPRRLARALCPVDRTATGELRSRIANRIQALVDAGKLVRERLVVGGTSVETILVRDEKNGRTAHATPEPAAPAVPAAPAAPKDSESGGLYDLAIPEVMVEGEPVGEPAGGRAVEPAVAEEDGKSLALDLDALVESVLRAPELAANSLSREGGQEPEASSSRPEPAPPAEPEAPPKRTRSRRRTSKVAASESNEAAQQ